MSDATCTITGCCVDCGTYFPRLHGNRKRCDACRYRPPKPTTFTCVDCLGAFPRPSLAGAVMKRCDDCRRTEGQRNSRDQLTKRLASKTADFEAHGRVSHCLGCGDPIQNARQGMLKRVCAPCKKAGVRRPRTASVAKLVEFTCKGCKKTLPNLSFNRISTHCSPCRAERDAQRVVQWRKDNPERARLLRKRHDHARRARLNGVGYEAFDPVEIYERDRWMCQICHKRISRRLRSPHPMSVSIDHIVPVSQGGDHVRANVRAAHMGCNAGRCNRGGNEQLMLVG